MSAAAWQPLAAALGELSLDDVPRAVADHASRVIADTVGVIVAGTRHAEVRALHASDSPLFPSARRADGARLLADGGGRAEPAFAAFANATAGTFLELDEGVRPTGHPGVHVIPAALAAAEALHRSGDELLIAVIAGYELTARLFEAYELTFPLHPHGHLGAMGAALAVARLRGVDPVPAVEMAATFPLLSVWEPCFEGATARNAFAGVAAAAGVTAHRLVEAGFRGSRGATNAAFDGLVGRQVDPSALTAPVSPIALRIAHNYFKFHSACVLTHAAVDAVRKLGRRDPDEVESVLVQTTSGGMRIARQPLPNPLSIRFSLPYVVAVAIVHGRVAPETVHHDDAVAALALRVSVEVDDLLDAEWPVAAPARVILRTADGGREEALVMNHRGHHANPCSADELRAKFAQLAGPAWEPAYARLAGLRGVADCRDLFDDDV